MATTTPDRPTVDALVEELCGYRQRAAALTAAILSCDPHALTDTDAFFDELEDRFVRPITVAYEEIPTELRAEDRIDEADHRETISHLVTAFAGAWELRGLRDVALGWSVPHIDENTTSHYLELVAAGVRYREHFGGV